MDYFAIGFLIAAPVMWTIIALATYGHGTTEPNRILLIPVVLIIFELILVGTGQIPVW